MIYRPQLAWKVPDGYTAEPFDYYWDEQSTQLRAILNQQTSSVPFLTALTIGGQVTGIPLQLDPDADWVWLSTAVGIRGTNYTGANNTANGTADYYTIVLRFRDPWGNYLSNDYEPVAWWCTDLPMDRDSFSQGVSDQFQGLGPTRPMEPPIVCPAGSTIQLDLAAESRAANNGLNVLLFGSQGFGNYVQPPFPIYLRGMKLYPKGASCLSAG